MCSFGVRESSWLVCCFLAGLVTFNNILYSKEYELNEGIMFIKDVECNKKQQVDNRKKIEIMKHLKHEVQSKELPADHLLMRVFGVMSQEECHLMSPSSLHALAQNHVCYSIPLQAMM